MRRAPVTPIALLFLLLAGCAERARTEGAPEEREDPSGERAAPAGKAATFDEEYERVLALEEDARFSAALALLGHIGSEFAAEANPETLAVAKARLEHERRAALDLPSAVKGLGSESAEVVAAAGRQFVKAGRAGRIYLTKAVLEEDGKIAIEAVKLLVELKETPPPAVGAATVPRGGDNVVDPTAPRLSTREALSARLASNPSEALRSVLARGLVEVSRDELERDELEDEEADRVLKGFYQLIKDDRRFVYRELASAVCRAFEVRLKNDRDRLARAVGDRGAYARLRLYVESALSSGDGALAAWAADCAAAVDLMVPGLRGSYYHGRNFEKLVHERLDRKIDVADRRFPYPDSRQDDISVRWTGFVRVERAGKYTFYSAADDGHRLWVDGRQLVNDWGMHAVQERSGQIELGPGHYPFKVEFMQGAANASIRVSWQGPGVKKQVISAGALMTAPWKGMK